jgi:hypothetical protein
MPYTATIKLSYLTDTVTPHSNYFPEIVDKQTITIEAPAQDLNTHQYFELFKSFLRAVGFDEYNIMEAACRIAFNDSNDEAKMKKIADEYELFLAEDYHKKIGEYDAQQDRDIAGLEAEIKELKAKLARVLPEQYKSWGDLVPGSPEAVANFCSCPVMDNAEMPNDKKWVNGDCPLHGKVK